MLLLQQSTDARRFTPQEFSDLSYVSDAFIDGSAGKLSAHGLIGHPSNRIGKSVGVQFETRRAS
jgi:hypothetical protein